MAQTANNRKVHRQSVHLRSAIVWSSVFILVVVSAAMLQYCVEMPIVRRYASETAKRIPSWIPIWTIDEPVERIDSRLPTSSEIEFDAVSIAPFLQQLTKHTYFSLFKINLGAECPLWVRTDVCTSPTGNCAVCECSEDNIPIRFKEMPTVYFVDRHLSAFTEWEKEDDIDSVSSAESSFVGGLKRNMFESVSDESSKQATYVDLRLNLPGNTGYTRTPIWSLIYKENCMADVDNPLAPEEPGSTVLNGQCREEESFYKIVSGIQTDVTALVAEYYYRDMPERNVGLKQYWPHFSLSHFRWRLAPYAQYTENMYFTFSLIMRTICEAERILIHCDCDTGDVSETAEAQKDLMEFIQHARKLNSCHSDRTEHPFFRRTSSLALNQFRNISRILDCVDCESCRLHAKIKVLAAYLVLKATSNPKTLVSLERNELIALFNSALYFNKSVLSFMRFRTRLLILRYVFVFLCVGLSSLILSTVLWFKSASCREYVRKCNKKIS